MSRFGISVLIVCLLLSAGAQAIEAPSAVAPGEAFLLRVPGRAKEACLLKHCFPLVSLGSEARGFVAVPYGASPGRAVLEIHFASGKRASVGLNIIPKTFPEEHLKLPPKMVTFDKKTLARIKRERARLLEALKPVTKEEPYLGPFVRPVEGRLSSPFGLRRILNGQPRSPHMGVDFAAPEGTPVVAFGDGQVVLTGDFYLSGRTVVINHGLGLYSIYCHLKEIVVTEGDKVRRGQRIGLVGRTGRVTGPHLHFGVSLTGLRVDPLSLITLRPFSVRKETSHGTEGL